MELPQVTIYIDGACSGNPGPGGWAAILISGPHRKSLQGAEENTTNNRMELKAAIEAIRALKYPSQVAIYTDSRYLINGITHWLPQWRRRNWRKLSGGVVENRDLWEELDALSRTHFITWKWVKGHSEDPLNREVHNLATQAITLRPQGSSSHP
ncbi:MAG: ribonuclease HI [bacterium]